MTIPPRRVISGHFDQLSFISPSRQFGTFWPVTSIPEPSFRDILASKFYTWAVIMGHFDQLVNMSQIDGWGLRKYVVRMSHNDGSGIKATGQNVPNWRLGDMISRQNSIPVPKRVDCAHKGALLLKTDFTSRRRNSNEGSVWGFKLR